jgi:anti-anti-sigma factor
VELTRKLTTAGVEVTVSGRLDSYWADHLKETLNEAVRQGSHDITLDLAQVQYISSAGIGVLAAAYQKLSAIQGRLQIVRPSDTVVKILRLCGLSGLLLGGGPSTPGDAPAREAPASVSERDGVRYSVFEGEPDARLACRMIGDPRRLEGCRFGPDDVSVVSIAPSSLVVGLGAFGDEFDACRDRFGEFLAVAGTAAYLPTDGTGIPDYLVSAESSLPETTLLYAVSCDGPFARLIRFESEEDSGGVPLSRLLEDCLSLGGIDTAGVVLVAESAGLAGAALRRSPAAGENGRAPFSHPEIREWLSFSAERVYSRSVVVAGGVATRVPFAPLAPMVRPLGEGHALSGHIHAAAFTYAPLPRGPIGLRETVAGLYETQKLQTVLHLLRDGRPITGAGESAFSRGACWIAPLRDVGEPGSSR